MEIIKLQADLVIFGDGIASLALAHLAVRRDIGTVILGKNLRGTTYSATGWIAPRPDYLLVDEELVERTAFECFRWSEMFYPHILESRLNLIPLGPETPHGLALFHALLTRYDELAQARFEDFENHFFVNRAVLEKMEPNLRRKDIEGAIAVREWTVNPAVLMSELKQNVLINSVKWIEIGDIESVKINNGVIEEISVCRASRKDSSRIKVSNDRRPLLVVNAAGPWMKDVCSRLGILMDYQLRAGIQIEVPGHFFYNNIITFGNDGKYVACFQKKNILQIGPTNSRFSDHPDNFYPSDEDIGYLQKTLANILKDDKVPQPSSVRWGFRVKPTIIDTNRPVIWNHASGGVANMYSLHPGKMALALLAGDEMLDRATKDGWLSKPRKFIDRSRSIHLDGNRKVFNEIKLFLLKMRSLIRLGLFCVKFLLSSK